MTARRSRKKPGTYEMLDAWRGLAALWVVVFHASSEIMLAGFPIVAHSAIYRPVLVGYLGVQIFFVISGYCIANAACVNMDRQQGWWAFTYARLRRIFPPMWISLVFFAGFKIAASLAASYGMLGGAESLSSDFLGQGFLYYFSNATLTQIVFGQEWLSRVCWTLCYELAFYIAMAALIVVADLLRKPRLVLNTFHAISCLCLTGLLLAPERMVFPFDLWPQFGLGVLVFDLIRSRGALVPRVWASVLGFQTAAFIFLVQMPLGFQHNPSRHQFIACLALAALLLVLYRVDRRLAGLLPVRWLAVVGRFSYSLYLIHLLIITVLVRLLGSRIPQGLHLLYVLLLCAASVAAAWIFYRLFEKPFLRVRAPVAGPLPVLEPTL